MISWSAQFENLKHALTHAPILQPPNYNKDYSFYLVASLSTIGMVLVQTYEHDHEHVIYYLSKSLMDSETCYSHVEKLALATVIVVQKFHHYVLLQTTTVYADSNPMHYILTRQVLGGKYSCWIVILQGFELEFSKTSSKKSLVFAKLMCDLTDITEVTEPIDSFPDESLFLISTADPWYEDSILYLQNECFQSNLAHGEYRCICNHAKYFLIVNNAL